MAEPNYSDPRDPMAARGGLEEDSAEAQDLDAQLDALGIELSRMRCEAIDGRFQTGIEQEWLEDEEFYEGIDDANRAEMGAWRSKPPNQVVLGDEEDDDGVNQGSTVFFNMTRAYVDAGAARLADMLLPTDDRAWSIKPTPVPDLVGLADAKLGDAEVTSIYEGLEDGPERERNAIVAQGKMVRDRMPPRIRDQVDAAARDRYAQDDPAEAELSTAKSYMDLADQVAQELAEANQKAMRAQTRIEDWHVECQYHAHNRQVIEDAARIGTGVLKGPIPVRRRQVVYDPDENTVSVQWKLSPASIWVDPWNCFPDPACGSSIHDGAYHWERSDITARKLSELRSQPGYMRTQINMCLAEGPFKAVRNWDPEAQGKGAMLGMTRRDRSRLFEIWYGYVYLSGEDAALFGVDLNPDEEDDPYAQIPCCVTMVNNHVIKAVRNILDTGEFPYDYMVWQRRADLPWGIGVARQMRTPQRVINAAARNMMDNAGLAGGAMWAFALGVIEPLDGVYEIRPRKGWVISRNATEEQLKNAFQYFRMDIYQEELERILQLGLKMAEDVTGMPMLLQGQMGDAPDTVGGMTMLSNNASSVTRRLARLYDDLVTEPHVRRYYTYLLHYGDEAEKGDFMIDARGSSALVERDINNQALMQLGNFVTNPIFKKDPAKWLDEFMKSQKLDPKRLDYDDEEWQQIVEGLAQAAQAGDSSVEAAKVRAEAMVQVQNLRNELEQARMVIENDRAEAQDQRAQRDREIERQMAMALEAINDEFRHLELSITEKMAADEVRAKLAEVSAKLTAQFAMQREENRSAQLLEPPVEPTGRAPEGHAFEA